MIEKALAAALEPVVDDLISLEKKVSEIQLKEGPAGTPGVDGAPGKDADPVDIDVVVEKLFETHAEQLRGESASPVDVGLYLMENHSETLRGADAELDLEAFSKTVFGHEDFDRMVQKHAREAQEAADQAAIAEINLVFKEG